MRTVFLYAQSSQVAKRTLFAKHLRPRLAILLPCRQQNIAPTRTAKKQCAGTVFLYAVRPPGALPLHGLFRLYDNFFLWSKLLTTFSSPGREQNILLAWADILQKPHLGVVFVICPPKRAICFARVQGSKRLLTVSTTGRNCHTT